MKCLICERESGAVRPRELPWKISRRQVEEAARSRLLPESIPSTLLDEGEISFKAPLCDPCDGKVRSGEICRDEIALRALIAGARGAGTKYSSS